MRRLAYYSWWPCCVLHFVWPIAIIVNRDSFFVTMFLLGWAGTLTLTFVSKYLRRWRVVVRFEKSGRQFIYSLLPLSRDFKYLATAVLYYRGPCRETLFVKRTPGNDDIIDYELWHGPGRAVKSGWRLDEVIPLATIAADHKVLPSETVEENSYVQEVSTLQFGKRWRLRLGGQGYWRGME